jgi:hypothetical protein
MAEGRQNLVRMLPKFFNVFFVTAWDLEVTSRVEEFAL